MTTSSIELGEVEGADGARSMRCRLPPDLAFFDGHFPGLPVLPAVVQLERIVLPAIARAFPELGALRRATRLKFRRPVAPGAALEVRLERGAGGVVRFTLLEGDEVCSGGALELEEEAR